MTCTRYADNLIVCSTPTTRYRFMLKCPICKGRKRATRIFGGWYGDIITCCGCGNSWNDGYPMSRTRSERVKARNIAKAKAEWAGAQPAAAYRSELDRFLADYTSAPP